MNHAWTEHMRFEDLPSISGGRTEVPVQAPSPRSSHELRGIFCTLTARGDTVAETCAASVRGVLRLAMSEDKRLPVERERKVLSPSGIDLFPFSFALQGAADRVGPCRILTFLWGVCFFSISSFPFT